MMTAKLNSKRQSWYVRRWKEHAKRQSRCLDQAKEIGDWGGRRKDYSESSSLQKAKQIRQMKGTSNYY